MASKKTSQRPQITSLATGDRIKAIDVSEPDATKDAWFTLATLTTYLQTLLMANPMTTAGDLPVGGSGGTPTRLGIGANGRVLGVSGGALAYLDLSGVYEAARTVMSQATAEGGSDTAVFSVNALRLRQAANAAIAAWVGAAPGALDTLDELAAALNDDASFAATMTTALAGKQPLDATLTALAGLTVAADNLIYATGADAFATVDFPAFARTLVGAANAGAAARALREAATVITYNTTITPNCNDGLHRVCTMTGNLIVNAPTNGADGMVWRGRFVASGAARELTFHSSVKAPYGSTYEATVESGATRIIHLEHDGSRWMIVRNLEFAP